MKKVFICATVYQIICALQLRITEFKDEEADIILTDDIPDYKLLVEKIDSLSIFSNTLYVEEKKMKFRKMKLKHINFFYKSFLKSNKSLFSIIGEKNSYSEIFFANLTGNAALRTAKFLYANNKAKLNLYEDGTITYSKSYEEYFVESSSLKKEVLKKMYNFYNSINEIYLFEPRLLTWNPRFSVRRISPLKNNIEKIKGILNEIFNYRSEYNQYNEKVIFLEESYFCDGIEVNDISILEGLENRYGKDNIKIKLHPRNKINRFEKTGFKTSIDQLIPWEVILLNMDLEDKILASISSTALLNSVLLFNTDATVIFFYENIQHIENNRIQNIIPVIKKAGDIFPNKIYTKLE